MAWLCVDKDGTEAIFSDKPVRNNLAETWNFGEQFDMCVELPRGSIAKLIGRELTWSDEPVEL